MEFHLPSIVMGWPAIISSLIVSYWGIIKKRSWMLVLGALIAIPFSFYISMSPRFQYVGLVFPMLQIGAAVFIHQNKMKTAVLLVLPFTVFSMWFAFSVVESNKLGNELDKLEITQNVIEKDENKIRARISLYDNISELDFIPTGVFVEIPTKSQIILIEAKLVASPESKIVQYEVTIPMELLTLTENRNINYLDIDVRGYTLQNNGKVHGSISRKVSLNLNR